jgi:hypothetical protein
LSRQVQIEAEPSLDGEGEAITILPADEEVIGSQIYHAHKTGWQSEAPTQHGPSAIP